jgi:hypothetical protein
VEFFLEDYDFNADDQFQVEDGDGMFCMRIATPSVPIESGSSVSKNYSYYSYYS